MAQIKIRAISVLALILAITMVGLEWQQRLEPIESQIDLHLSSWKLALIYKILFFVAFNLILSFRKSSKIILALEIFCIGWVIGEFVYWGIWSSDLIHRMLPEHDRLVALYDGDWVAVALLFSVLYLFSCLINNALTMVPFDAGRKVQP